MSPEHYVANKISWQFFATLTFSRMPSDAVKQKMLFAWLRWFSEMGRKQQTKRAPGTRPERLLWMVREELGEVSGRFHYHALLAGLPQHLVNVKTAMASCAAWENQGGGMARNYIYQSDLDGADYVLKGLTQNDLQATNRYGQYLYEVGKFNGEEGRRVLLGHDLTWKLVNRKSNKRLVTARAMRALRRGN